MLPEKGKRTVGTGAGYRYRKLFRMQDLNLEITKINLNYLCFISSFQGQGKSVGVIVYRCVSRSGIFEPFGSGKGS
jgi:hypothetical protein